MDAWILDAKLQAPELPAGHLARGLAGRVGAAPVALLEGGPGAGKTVALRELIEAASADGALAVWYALDPADAEPASFFHYLVAGLQRHVPDAGEEALALLRAEKADPRLLWQAIFRVVSRYNLPGLVIALDDVHHLETTPALLEGLAYMAAALPAGVRVVAASRRPVAAFARLRARGHLARLGPAELAFSPAEAEAFLEARAGGPPPAAWRSRAAALEGWPLGLAFIALGLAEDGRPDEVALDEYVALEAFGHQPPERQAWMLRAALLPTLTPAAFAAAFGGQDAPAHLAALEHEHLVQRLDECASWRFPGYLATFLAREADRRVAPAELAAWRQAVGARAMAAGQPEAALPLLLAAGDLPAALAAAEAAFSAMRHDGRHAALERLLASFPAAAHEAEPTLQLWTGHMRSRRGDRPGALDAYARARAGYREAGRPEGELAALVRLATLAARTRDLPTFGKLVLEALALVPAGRPEDVADLHLARALAADIRGDHALMRACNEDALAVPAHGNVEAAASHAIARLNLFTAATQVDDLATAEAHAEAARATAEAHGLAPYASYATFLLAHVRLARGDTRAAAEAVAAAPSWWPQLLDWHMAGVAFTVVGALHTAQGDWPAAERALAEALARWDAAGYVEGRKISLAELAKLALRRGRPAEVAAIAARAELPEDPEAWNAYDIDIAVRLAEARLALGDAAGASRLLAPALAGLERLGARRRLAEARGLAEAAEGKPAAPPQLDAARGSPPVPNQAGGLVLGAFGGFEVRIGATPITAWPRRKAKVLLAALALREGPVGSLELAEVLGEGDATSGLGILKVAARSLRKALEPDLAAGAPSAYVRTMPDGYALAWEAVAGCDLRGFERAMANGDAARDADPRAAEAAYREALALYRGDLFDEPVLREAFELERARLKERALAACRWLAGAAAERGDAAAVEAAWRRAIAIDPCDEPAYLALIQHLQASGAPERARQAYWDCRGELKRRLGVEPGPELEAAARPRAAAG